MKRTIRDLERFTAPVQSLLLVGAGGNGGAGATALAAWTAADASVSGASDYERFVTSLDVCLPRVAVETRYEPRHRSINLRKLEK